MSHRPSDPERRATNLAKLPPVCYATNPQDNKTTIIIKRGQPGYFPTAISCGADNANLTLTPPPTPAQVEAMLCGSMFGWACPGANPDLYTGKAALERDDEIEPLILTASQRNTLVNALHIAAARYRDDTKVCGREGQVRLAEQFSRQQREAYALIEILL